MVSERNILTREALKARRYDLPTISLPSTRRIPAPACTKRSFSPVGSRYGSSISPVALEHFTARSPKA